MFLQMNVALSVEQARDPGSTLTPRRVLEMATLAGARDLGLDDRIGSLTPGKRADLIGVRLDSLNMAPAADPLRSMVLCARPSDVDLVIADGRVLKRAGQLTVHDAPATVAAADETLRRVVARSGWDVALAVSADTGRAA
jgi:cytosine/adenosine deaminase-related metal-dependent hydrolase